MTGHLMDISGGLNSSLELVILIIMVKNTTFIAYTAVWHDSGLAMFKNLEVFLSHFLCCLFAL